MNATPPFAVHFLARRTPSLPGEAMIYLRISVARKQLELSLRKKVPRHCWDVKGGCVKGDKQLAQQ
ncbi:MAG: Arm DNA-binding domain, partial [Flavisolibacter sp.]|nr:Arm DNA-binding domain [Flavisolibacter sp.]